MRAGYPSRPATKAYLDHELCITLRRNRPPMLLAFRGQLLQCMEKTLGDHISTTLERHTMPVFPVQAFHHGETSIRWRCFFCCSVLASLRLNFRIAVCDLHQSNDDVHEEDGREESELDRPNIFCELANMKLP